MNLLHGFADISLLQLALFAGMALFASVVGGGVHDRRRIRGVITSVIPREGC